MQPYLAKWRYPWIGAQWLFLRRGPGATNHFEAGGFVRSNDDVTYPNLMFHFLPIAVRYDGRPRPADTATRCTSVRCTPTGAARCRS
jgi:choline dehydrogenase